MQASQLVGFWKLKSVSTDEQLNPGLKFYMVEFRADGRWFHAGIRPSRLQGLLPETKFRAKGTWKLEGDILESTLDGVSFKTKINIDNDILKIAFVDTTGIEESRLGETAIYERVTA